MIKALPKQMAQLLEKSSSPRSETDILLSELPEITNGNGKSLLYVGASIWRAYLLDEFIAWGWKPLILEVFPPNVEYWGQVRKIPTVQGDICSVALPHYDLAFWWHGPEHVHKEYLPAALQNIERAADLVILSCPEGDSPQGAAYENPFEKHLWSVSKTDLDAFGYNTRVDQRPNTNIPGIIAWKRNK